MNRYLQKMERSIDEKMHQVLEKVHLPQQVAIPCGGVRPALCVTEQGEIRCYGLVDGGRAPGYLSGIDGGMSFKEYYVHSSKKQDVLGAAAYFAYNADGTFAQDDAKDDEESEHGGRYFRFEGTPSGTVCRYSDIGMNDTDYHTAQICDTCYHVDMLPRVTKNGRIYAAGWRRVGESNETAFFFSDDGGMHFTTVVLPSLPAFPAVYPDRVQRPLPKGTCPTVIERLDGSMWMLVATSDSYLWEYVSTDGGNHWEKPRRTTLHGSYTGAYLLRLQDDRLLLFWNNTDPMPTCVGVDTSLTNRDACHCAVSVDEGKSWVGQRELFLPACRTYADGMLRCGNGVSDFEALEMPDGNVLVHVGTTPDTERLILFCVDYLNDAGRVEDFLDGVYYFSTQSYFRANGSKGFNRIPGPVAVQDPQTVPKERDKREVLHIYRYADDRLLSEQMGAVQNFPAWEMGEITLEVMLSGAPLRVSLCDHWINPSDPCVEEKSVFSFTMDYLDTWRTPDVWATYKIAYSLKHQKAVVIRVDMSEEDYLPDRLLHNVLFSVHPNHRISPLPRTLSYLHLQTASKDRVDEKGSYIGRIEYRSIDSFPYMDLH